MKKFLIGFGIFMWVGIILTGFVSFFKTQNYSDLAAIAFVIIVPSLVIIMVNRAKKKNNNVLGTEKYNSLKSENDEKILNRESENNYSYDTKEECSTLISCPMCNKEVSSQAAFCTNCGNPMAGKAESGRVENKVNKKDAIDFKNLMIRGKFKHINGLNIAENAQCEVLLYPTGYEFKSGAIKFNLPKSKVIDVAMKTDREIQQQYVSSVGGAVGGAFLFGPLGAMIGGRAKKKTIAKYSSYLIITYKDGEDIKYIGFDATNAPFKAMKFESEFKKTNSTITSFDL